MASVDGNGMAMANMAGMGTMAPMAQWQSMMNPMAMADPNMMMYNQVDSSFRQVVYPCRKRVHTLLFLFQCLY